MNIRFFSNTNEDMEVALPSGKLSKDGKRKPLKQQTGMTCVFYASRRITVFNADVRQDKKYQVYRCMKNALATYHGNVIELTDLALTLFELINLDVKTALLTNKNFTSQSRKFEKNNQSSMLCSFTTSTQMWLMMYEIFIDHILKPVCNLQDAAWHPRDGFTGLRECLRKNGALLFIGRFGAYYYQKPAEVSKSQTNKRRCVFFYEKKFYQGDKIPFSHSIIVDQVKVVNNKEMVFFRDACTPSIPGKKEMIFMMSYKNFVDKLVDQQNHRYSKNECCPDMTFGMASAIPEKLYGPQV